MLLHATHGRSKRPGHLQRVVRRGSYEKVHAPGRILRQRLEHLRDRFALQSLPPHVAHDADDCEPRAVGIPRAQLEPFAHRIAPGPRAASHRIVDDRHRRSIRPIPDRKEAASEQRRPEGLEEFRADLVSSEPQALGHRSVVPFGSDDLFPVATDEQIADDAGALHTGNRLNLFEHAVVKVGPLRGDAEGRRGGELHRQGPAQA